jgi:hypothetical protein
VGQKVLSKPSADSFAVGRRQKVIRYSGAGGYRVTAACDSALFSDRPLVDIYYFHIKTPRISS